MSGYAPRAINRRRRTKVEMQAIRDAIVARLTADHPMSVRGLFYALTTEGVIAKTEAEYGTVKKLTARMRRSGEIPYTWLADATRWMRKPETFSSAEDALRRTASVYRRALWDDAPVRVEIWLEKEALAGVLVGVTDEWDVPLMVTRGYPSLSFVYSAAEAIRARAENGQRTAIYYFGDRDPSGEDIDRAIVKGIGESLEAPEPTCGIDVAAMWAGLPDDPREAFADHADFTRVAVTEAQIEKWDLPTRPTKVSDSRAKNFKGPSVELDAIPSHLLRWLAANYIEAHVDHRRLDVLRTFEAEERRGLEQMADAFGAGER